MTFGEKIKKLRKLKGLTQIQFEEKFNISNGAIALWETNKRQPDYEMLNKIATFFDVSVDYILGTKEPKQEKSTGVKIPVLGSIPAGIPLEAIEDILDWEEISEAMAMKGDFFGLKVKGNSMLPTIKDGDTVIFRRQEDTESGKICVVMINGFKATLKEVKKNEKGIYVVPHNPDCDFTPTFFSNEEIESLPVKIIGIAVEIRRSL